MAGKLQLRGGLRKSPADTPVAWLVKKFREHLHFPDETPIHVFFGAVAANMLEGDPVWPMLVGPPSCGKSELLSSILGLEGMHEAARINGDSAFLSGTARKDRAKDSSGGILRKVGGHGGVVMNDFTSVLTLPKEKLDAVLSVFRECYIGRWTRDIGSDGGRTLVWEGKVAYFGGVTGKIDEHHEANSSLGERWIYYRMEKGDGWERTKRALSKRGNGWRLELREHVNAFFAGLDLNFGKIEKSRRITEREQLRLYEMGAVAAACRSPVVRDRYTREIIGAKESEAETRLVVALSQLLIGMEYIGVTEADRWKALQAVALDSMPKLRRVVIDQLRREKVTTYGALAQEMGVSRTTAERTVEDLEVHGIVDRSKAEGIVQIQFSDWMRAEQKKGWL